VVELLATRLGVRLRAARTPAWTGRGQHAGREIILARPRTYMNESGIAGARLVRDLGLTLDQVLVVYDDLDLAVGKLRLRRSGSPGGHNGIRSLQAHWRSQEFARLRVGIGRPPPGVDPIDYVLGRPEGEERELLESSCERAAEAALSVAERGLEATMTEYNRGAGGNASG
jgi:PTH1 family peptidyl-tRNA hydrolase